MDPLLTSLLDLLYELRDQNMPLTIGGGFGLFLKRRHLLDQKKPTLFTELPEARATNDIDIFLRVDLLTDPSRTETLVRAVQSLGYVPVEEAKYFQWKRSMLIDGMAQEVKLDALVGPLGNHVKNLQVKPPRVRPKGKKIGFHAYKTDEALFLEENPIAVAIRGKRSNGQDHTATIFVPEAFPYLLMKLSAFADRQEDNNKDLGRHHALDVYTIVGLMTEAEYDRAKELAGRSRSDPHYARVCEVVATEFSAPTSLGILRLREHRLWRADFRINDFTATLREIFNVS